MSDNLPVPANADYVKISRLRQKLEELIECETALRMDAADRVIAVFENNVRIGWCLIDIKTELKGDWDTYAENCLPFTGRQARKLIQGAKLFQRDQENAIFLSTLQTASLEYSYSEKPLVEQIREIRNQPDGPKYFSDLLVTSGLAPGRQAKEGTPRSNVRGFFKLVRAIDNACAALTKFNRECPIDDWSEDDCEIMKRKMQPLKEFYESNF